FVIARTVSQGFAGKAGFALGYLVAPLAGLSETCHLCVSLHLHRPEVLLERDAKIELERM
ncbi:MAG: hypothetical protein JXR96_30125, partial [Deltaproteobacteria bacterium]|nr:hypothetical protein [Deltaproteobacteria bacterium]